MCQLSDDLDALMNGFTTSGWKRSSLSPVANGVRSFLRFAERQRWCSPGLSEAVSAPRTYVDERLPKGLDWEAVTSCCPAPTATAHATSATTRLSCCSRSMDCDASEVAAIRLEDINWDKQPSGFATKQRHSQLYPLHAVIGNAIARYLRDARPPSKSRYVFCICSHPLGTSVIQAFTMRLATG